VAFRSRRRRRPLVQWFPGFRAEQVGETPQGTDPGGVQGGLNLEPSGEVIYDAFPLTWDASKDINDQGDPSVSIQEASLKDLVGGNEWRLRRIVGKFFVGATSDEIDDPAAFQSLVDVSLGFIVVKTIDDGAPTTIFDEVNPMSIEGYDDPWIWRRRWLLNPYGPGAFINSGGALDTRGSYGYINFPQTNAGYGSIQDGPHIDQKTARRIHRQERLFAIIAARQFSNFLGSGACRIDYLLDYRLLGSIIASSVGNRRNASR